MDHRFDNCLSLYKNAKILTKSGRAVICSSVEGIEKKDGIFCSECLGARFSLSKWSDRDELIRETGFNLNYLENEFEERIDYREPHNPGEAWKLALKDKGKHLLKSGRFPYTYSERMYGQIDRVVSVLREDLSTRQALISIWDSHKDPWVMGKGMIPCSLYYHFLVRKGGLIMIYGMRSLDVERFPQDIWLATKLIDHVAQRLKIPPLLVVFFISSLHYFVKEKK